MENNTAASVPLAASRCSINLNPDPLLPMQSAAAYIGFASAKSLSTVLNRGTYKILSDETVYIGRRPHFRLSTLEKFIKSRTGAELAKGAQ